MTVILTPGAVRFARAGRQVVNQTQTLTYLPRTHSPKPLHPPIAGLFNDLATLIALPTLAIKALKLGCCRNNLSDHRSTLGSISLCLQSAVVNVMICTEFL